MRKLFFTHYLVQPVEAKSETLGHYGIDTYTDIADCNIDGVHNRETEKKVAKKLASYSIKIVSLRRETDVRAPEEFCADTALNLSILLARA